MPLHLQCCCSQAGGPEALGAGICGAASLGREATASRKPSWACRQVASGVSSLGRATCMEAGVQGSLATHPPCPPLGRQHMEARPFSGERPSPEPHGSRGQGEGEGHQGQQARTTDGLEPEARDLQQLLSPPACSPPAPPHGPGPRPSDCPERPMPRWTGGGILPPKLGWSHHHPGTSTCPREPVLPPTRGVLGECGRRMDRGSP